MNKSNFLFIQELLFQRVGNILEPQKEYLLDVRLSPLVRTEGFDTLEAFLTHLRNHRAEPLIEKVLDALTTNETLFFRDEYPFQILEKIVIPTLISKRGSTCPLNLWSAACASGQEPYSIAMLLSDHFPQLLGWKNFFLATDVSNKILNRAKQGLYNTLEIRRGLPEDLLNKYFQKCEEDWKIADSIKSMILFQKLNLIDPWPSLPLMDIIFLRNVLIYMTMEHKKQIFKKLTKLLKPDGYLFLGGSETVFNISSEFKRVPFERGSYYQLA